MKTVKEIIIYVANHFSMNPKSLTSRNRFEPLATRRQMVMMLASEQGHGCVIIAKGLKRHHHTTVLAGIHSLKNKMDTEPKLRAEFQTLQNKLATNGK